MSGAEAERAQAVDEIKALISEAFSNDSLTDNDVVELITDWAECDETRIDALLDMVEELRKS